MSDLDLEKLERHVRGFPGKFQLGAYDDGTEQLEYIGPDGDEDDPYVVGEGVEQHVAEPIADMLNAVPDLIAAVKAAEQATAERIAAWLESHSPQRAPYPDLSRRTATDIRSGAWRKQS